MCVDIGNDWMRDESNKKWSDILLDGEVANLGIYHVTNYMNPIELAGVAGRLVIRHKEMECLEDLGRRVVGALGYLGLIVAALVEAAARLVFGALALVPTALYAICDGGTALEQLSIRQMLWSVIILIDNPLRCLSGIVQKAIMDKRNEHGHRISYEDLTLCALC